jgi:hypothetical protein
MQTNLVWFITITPPALRGALLFMGDFVAISFFLPGEEMNQAGAFTVTYKRNHHHLFYFSSTMQSHAFNSSESLGTTSIFTSVKISR